MRRPYHYLLLLFAAACGQPDTHQPPSSDDGSDTARSVAATITYAKNFTIDYHDGYKLVHVLDHEMDKTDTLEYLLVQKGRSAPAGYPHAQIISIPISTIVTTASSHIGIADFAGVGDRVTGLGSLQYVNSPIVRANIKAGKVTQVGMEGNLNNEVIISMHPSIVLASSNPKAGTGQYQALQKAGIPVVLDAEWLETTPLGRAEWVKLMAALVNREERVSRKFDSIAAAYNKLAALGRNAAAHPHVIIGMPYKGTWFLPSADSYLANFIKDAGGAYKWSNEKATGSLALSFESAAPEALQAEYWMNIGQVDSRQDIAAKDSRYTSFRSYKTGMLYNNNKRTNELGSNDYWESGVVNPDVVLADMISILHPELEKDHTLVYYKKLQ